MKLKALNIEQAAIIASGLGFSEAAPDFFKLDDFKAFTENFFEQGGSIREELTGKALADYFQGKLAQGENLQTAHIVYNALIQEAELALFNTRIPSFIIEQTETVLTLFNQRQKPEECTFTRESIALWFYENGSIEKALLIYPEFEQPEAKKNREEELLERSIRLFHENKELQGVVGGLRAEIKALQAENEALKINVEPFNGISVDSINNYPSGIKAALKIYEECWAHLPDDYMRPRQKNLDGFLKNDLGIENTAYMDILRNLARPDNELAGGNQKKGRIKPWRQRKDI